MNSIFGPTDKGDSTFSYFGMGYSVILLLDKPNIVIHWAYKAFDTQKVVKCQLPEYVARAACTWITSGYDKVMPVYDYLNKMFPNEHENTTRR